MCVCVGEGVSVGGGGGVCVCVGCESTQRDLTWLGDKIMGRCIIHTYTISYNTYSYRCFTQKERGEEIKREKGGISEERERGGYVTHRSQLWSSEVENLRNVSPKQQKPLNSNNLNFPQKYLKIFKNINRIKLSYSSVKWKQYICYFMKSFILNKPTYKKIGGRTEKSCWYRTTQNEWQKKQRLVEKGILHIPKENGMGGMERGEVM